MAVSLSPFERRPSPWERKGRVLAGVATVVVHTAVGGGLAANETAHAKVAEWVEVTVTRPPPPPPPPAPEPPEAADKPKPKAKPPPVPERAPEVPPPSPEPTVAPTRRLAIVQGLSVTSFAPGAGTGLSVRAGTTTNAAAGDAISLEEAAQSYTSVTTPPRAVTRPEMHVPDEAKEAEVEGEIRVALDIGVDGRVTGVRVLSDLGHGTGEACAEAWKRSRWKPATKDGSPVAVSGVPQACTVRIVE